MTPDTARFGPGNFDGDAFASRPDPESIHVKFRFDLDDKSWLAQIRGFTQTATLGRIGSYDLLDVIGRGAQGIVHKARQPRTGRIVAIKRLAAGAFATPAMQDRFRREVEAAAALEHPGIVTIFGSEFVDGQAVLAMQWIEGQLFHKWAAERPAREILQAFAALCDAVQHAHQRGVIHRDLKPSNILVDMAGQPHVLDFGLAKLRSEESSSLTLTGDFLGTPHYAAPEQIDGRPGDVDIRTDVYSLGAVLYQSLTGRTLFPDTNGLKELFDAILSRDPVPPSSINPRLDREIDAIVLKAISKDKDLRYGSVEAVCGDVHRYLRGEAVQALPPSFRYLARKLVQRHRAAVITAVLFLFLLITATVATTVLYVRAENALKLAQNQEGIARVEIAKQKTVNQFLQDMLGRANKVREKGRDLTMGEVLDAAAEQLDANQAQYEPEVEAALRMAIALSYSNIGADSAERHLQRALDLRRQVLGDVHPDVLESAYYLARMVRIQGRFAEAEELLKLVIQNRMASEGPDSNYLAQAYTSLGILQRELGEYASAEATFIEAVRIYRKNTGDNFWVISALIGLAQIKLAQGYLDESESIYREALAIGRRNASDEIQDLAFPLIMGANALWRNDRREEAREWLEEGISIYDRLGVPHLPIPNRWRAQWAMEEDDFASAEHYLFVGLQTSYDSYGNLTLPTARLLVDLSRLRSLQGKPEDAEQAAREAVEVFCRTDCIGSPEGVGARLVHGHSLLELGRFADSEVSLLSAWESVSDFAQASSYPVVEHLSLEIIGELVRLYETWELEEPGQGHADAAENWRHEPVIGR